jgi:hypothetical protein
MKRRNNKEEMMICDRIKEKSASDHISRERERKEKKI